MTNRWDSSARPLFVKTIYVNGNRHAILSEEDPMLQSRNLFLRKQLRSESSMSCSSTHSTTTQDSQRSSSEVNFKASKTNRLRSNDLSTELQRCLVKLQFPVSIQESENSRKNIGDWCKETESFGNESARKSKWHGCSQCSEFNRKLDRDHEYFKESFTDEYAVSAREEEENDCDCDVGSGKVKEYLCNESTSKNYLIHCECKKNSSNSGHQLPCEKNRVDLEKNESILGETFRNLIMRSKSGDRAHVKNQRDYFYNVSSSNNVELYWNNYLAKTFNTSLTDRVVQWMDLAKRQRNNEEKEKIIRKELSVSASERLPTKKAEKQKVQKSINTIKYSNGSNAIKYEVEAPIKRERAFDIRDSGSSDVESEIKVNDDREVISFVEKTQMKKSEEKTEVSPNLNDEASIPEAKSPKKTEAKMNESVLNNSKADVLETQTLLHTARVEANEFQSSNKSKTEEKCTVKRVEKETSSSMLFTRKKVPKLYNNYFSHPLDGGRTDLKKVKEIKVRPMSFHEKRAASAKETKREFMEKVSTGQHKVKSQMHKSASDFSRFTNTKTWINQSISEDNYMSISRANFAHNILNQHLMTQQKHPNDLLRVRESRTLWETGKSIEKPQLHIFIPSVSRKEVSEETVSECESFLNESHT